MQASPPNKRYRDRWPQATAAFDRELKAIETINRLTAPGVNQNDCLVIAHLAAANEQLAQARRDYVAGCASDEKARALAEAGE